VVVADGIYQVMEDASPLAIELGQSGSSATFTLIHNTNPELVSPSLSTSTGDVVFTFQQHGNGSASLLFRKATSGLSPHYIPIDLYVLPDNDEPTANYNLGVIPVVANAPPQIYDLHSYFHDVDDADELLTYSIVTNSDPSLLIAQIHPDSHRLKVGFVEEADGFATLTIRATDSGGEDDEFTMSFSVSPMTEPETPTYDMEYGADPLLIALDSLFGVEHGVLNYSIQDNSPTSVVSAQIVNGTLIITMINNVTAEVSIIVISGNRTRTVNVSTTRKNSPPTLTDDIPTIHRNEDTEPYSLCLFEYFEDDDPSDTLTYTVTPITHSYPGWPIRANLDYLLDIGCVDLESITNQFGHAQYAVTATDTAGAKVSTDFWVIVEPDNDPPVASPIQNNPHGSIELTWDYLGSPNNLVLIDLKAVFDDVEDAYYLNYSAWELGGGTALTGEPFVDEDYFLHYRYETAPNFSGSSVIMIEAIDNGGESISASFSVSVAFGDYIESSDYLDRLPDPPCYGESNDSTSCAIAPPPIVVVDLEVQDPYLPEEYEMIPGGYLYLNSDFDQKNWEMTTISIEPDSSVEVIKRVQDYSLFAGSGTLRSGTVDASDGMA
jgi:hypothetical protein